MRCLHCHHENREGARFCDHCGTPLTGTPTAVTLPSLPPQSQAPLQYTPDHLVEKILTSSSLFLKAFSSTGGSADRSRNSI